MNLVPHGERIKENLPQDAFASSKQEGRAKALSNTTQPLRICTEGSMFAETRVRASNVMFDLDRPLHRWCGNFVTICSVAASVFCAEGSLSVFFFRISFTSVPRFLRFPIVEPHHAGNRIPPC